VELLTATGMNCMNDKTFIDTNILVYAHDYTSKEKQEISQKIIIELWENNSGVVSTQVLQEFYFVLIQKVRKPLTPAKAKGLIQNYISWDVWVNNEESILQTIDLQQKYKLSFWDSLMVNAAVRSNSKKIITEDLNSGQIIEGVVIESPFSE